MNASTILRRHLYAALFLAVALAWTQPAAHAQQFLPCVCNYFTQEVER
ncbi:MAG TPA: hypothetical protein VHI13_02480 [Candidatus Kapabacteria bacterium]|nr:hypothetical protein [Candidatus Kapabacteria bacterium]